MQTRIERVRAAYATLARPGGLAALERELFASDVEFDFTALPDGALLHGVEGFREFRRGSPWVGEVAVEPEEFVQTGPDEVLVLVRVRSRGAALGVEVEAPYAHLVTFRGDRVVRWKLFHDRGQARREAGLDR